MYTVDVRTYGRMYNCNTLCLLLEIALSIMNTSSAIRTGGTGRETFLGWVRRVLLPNCPSTLYRFVRRSPGAVGGGNHSNFNYNNKRRQKSKSYKNNDNNNSSSSSNNSNNSNNSNRRYYYSIHGPQACAIAAEFYGSTSSSVVRWLDGGGGEGVSSIVTCHNDHSQKEGSNNAHVDTNRAVATVYVSQKLFARIIPQLLLQRGCRVEVWAENKHSNSTIGADGDVSRGTGGGRGGREKWCVVKRGSPGHLSEFEHLLCNGSERGGERDSASYAHTTIAAVVARIVEKEVSTFSLKYRIQ